AERVAEHLQERAADVERLPPAAGQQDEPADVGRQPEARGEQHRSGLDLRRVGQPPDRLDHDHPGQAEQQQRVAAGGEHLGPLPAEGPAGGRDPSGHPDRQQGEADAERVGGHVAGVGEQREAAGEQSDDHLEDQHGDGDPEHGGQPAAVGGGSRPRAGTGVPVIVPHDYDRTAEARFAPMVWLMQPDPTAVLGELMRRARDAGPGQLASLVADAAAAVGLADAVIYLADYGQTRLMPVPYAGMPARLPLGVDGTLAGRAYRTGSPLTAEGTDQARRRLWLPLCEGHERLGVLEATVPAAGATDGGTAGGTPGTGLFANVVAMLVATQWRYGDVFELVRRVRPMRLPAEIQWRLLPPTTVRASGVSLSGLLEPWDEVGGDAFDYALNDGR